MAEKISKVILRGRAPGLTRDDISKLKSLTAWFCSHGFQDFGQRTKAGKGGLEQIETDSSGEQ